MIFSLFSFFTGSTRLYTENKTETLNILFHNDVNFFSLREEECGISFCVLSFSAKRTEKLLFDNSICVMKKENYGFPSILYSYRKRVGVLLGIAIMISLPYISENYLWMISVSGNTDLSDEEIISGLKKYGIYEGAYCKNRDVLSISNECLLEDERLSYMSINIIGNCAEIVVKERKIADECDKDESPSNIVAEKSGMIVEMKTESGEALVSPGDVVFAGETLISGVYIFEKTGKYAFSRSKGRILAETVREFYSEIPFYQSEKTVASVKDGEKSIIFFTKSIKISKGTGNLPPSCDRIVNRERMMLFGKIPLPLWIETEEIVSYEYTEKVLTKEEAIEKALEEINIRLSDFSIVSRSDEIVSNDRSVCVLTRANVIEEIGREVKLSGD